MNVKDKVNEFFREKNLPGYLSDAEALSYNYINNGLLDSMGIVNMIMEFEGTFGVQFDMDLLQSPEFAQIGGLIKIIENLLNIQTQGG